MRHFKISLLMAAALAQVTMVLPAGAETSMACVHWFSGESSFTNSQPPGQRGWNVEFLYSEDTAGGSNHDEATNGAQAASAAGFKNIIRIDFQANFAVPWPPTAGQDEDAAYGTWADNFLARVGEFRSHSRIFVVGNEPNLEDGTPNDPFDTRISGADYARAFGYLYARKTEGDDPSDPGDDFELLIAGPSGFSDPQWLGDVVNALHANGGIADGFALHTYGDPGTCPDPRDPCRPSGWNHSFDAGFRYLWDQIGRIQHFRWLPIYVTEFNTDTNGGETTPNPVHNYRQDWINDAFDGVRQYNANRDSDDPPVRALCWFVDRPRGWPDFSLQHIPQAETDMAQEFGNSANWLGVPPTNAQVVTGTVTQDTSSTETVWVENATVPQSADVEIQSAKEVQLTGDVTLRGEVQLRIENAQ